jgi:N-acetylmuramoyl-L-alanine amidase
MNETEDRSNSALRTFILLLLTVAAAGIVTMLVRSAALLLRPPAAPVATVAPVVAVTAVPTMTPLPPRRIGLVSGHRGNDSGAVCADGLTEAALNFRHAGRVAELLRAQGFAVEILGEFDPKLQGYRADVYLSIHADSCQYINELATGYKVARSRHSALPQVEDRLVTCISENYERTTGLRFHRNTVTANMLEYHGFYKIDPQTPAAIIETGFMNLDRKVIDGRAEDVARGIADGITCFLR